MTLLFKAMIRHDEYSGFVFAEKITQLVYPSYKFSEFGRTFLHDENFLRYYKSFENGNYHSIDRKYTLDQLAKAVVNVEGDTVECGAYMGASSYLICRRIAGLDKHHHIFDSFQGLSTPGPEDGTYWQPGNLRCGEDVIREKLREFDFVAYHQGWIPDKFHEVESKRFCFVHLDVDLYQPTIDSLTFFYDRVNPYGMILCDDYGFESCPGARRALDFFFDDKREKIVSLPTGQGLVIKGSD